MLGPLGEFGRPVLRLTNEHEGRESHASLTSRTEGGTRDGIQGMVLVAVRKDGSVVLGPEVGLHALAIGGSALVDVLARLVAPHKRDGLDARLVKDEVYRLGRTVDDVDDTRGKAGLLGQLGEDHHSTRVSFGRLDHYGVAGDRRNGNAPQWNHGREVERADGGHDTQRLAVGSSLHVLGHLQHLTRDLRCDSASSLGNLQPTQDITPCIGKGLTLFQRDGRC